MKFLVLLALCGIVAMQEDEAVNSDFLDGYNTFTSNVYNELRKENPEENFVVSPISVDIVLALAEYGSKGDTSKELVKGLSLPANKEKIRDAMTTLIPKLNVNSSYILNSANKVYVKQGYKLKDKFTKFATEVYSAEVEGIDFLKKDAAADSMNKWVEKQTLEKIKNLISADDLNEDTRTVLLNALYFRGEWLEKFDKSRTTKGIFYVNNEKKTDVDFMTIQNDFRYYANHELDAKFLELPYMGFDVTLTIALPNTKDGLKNLENNIPRVLDSTHYKFETVNVKLPKFKIESKTEFKPILQSLGIVNAFEDSAEFPEITDELLKISKVVQKAVIEVDESGTTAAAASAVIMQIVRSSGFTPKKPKEFIADHSFIFFLKYKSVVLFTGHYCGK